jgi:hypothetical protein
MVPLSKNTGPGGSVSRMTRLQTGNGNALDFIQEVHGSNLGWTPALLTEIFMVFRSPLPPGNVWIVSWSGHGRFLPHPFQFVMSSYHSSILCKINDKLLGYGQDEIFLFSTVSRLAFIHWVPGTLSPRVKRSEREADHSHPSSVKIKNVKVYLYSSVCVNCVVLN